MGGKSNPSMTNVVLLISFMMTLSHIPMFFANSLQGYKQQGFVDQISPKHTYRIINEFREPESVKIHCWSLDDDIGRHVLWSGQYFEWRFRMSFNIGKPTRFKCMFECRQYTKNLTTLYSPLFINNSWSCKFCLLRLIDTVLKGQILRALGRKPNLKFV